MAHITTSRVGRNSHGKYFGIRYSTLHWQDIEPYFYVGYTTKIKDKHSMKFQKFDIVRGPLLRAVWGRCGCTLQSLHLSKRWVSKYPLFLVYKFQNSEKSIYLQPVIYITIQNVVVRTYSYLTWKILFCIISFGTYLIL